MNISKKLGLGVSLVVMFGVAGVTAFSTSSADADAGSWGALAHSNRHHRHGAATHQATREKAEEIAIKRCGGAKDECKPVLTFEGECGAYAEGRWSRHFGWGKGHTKKEAKKAALDACRKAGGDHCTIRVHACSEEREVTEVVAPATAEVPDAGPAPDPAPVSPAPDDTASPDAGTAPTGS